MPTTIKKKRKNQPLHLHMLTCNQMILSQLQLVYHVECRYHPNKHVQTKFKSVSFQCTLKNMLYRFAQNELNIKYLNIGKKIMVS